MLKNWSHVFAKGRKRYTTAKKKAALLILNSLFIVCFAMRKRSILITSL
jgi:hypothetical protein